MLSCFWGGLWRRYEMRLEASAGSSTLPHPPLAFLARWCHVCLVMGSGRWELMFSVHLLGGGVLQTHSRQSGGLNSPYGDTGCLDFCLWCSFIREERRRKRSLSRSPSLAVDPRGAPKPLRGAWALVSERWGGRKDTRGSRRGQGWEDAW